MLAGGADIAVVSRQLGHTSLATTQVYVSAVPAAQIAAAALIDVG